MEFEDKRRIEDLDEAEVRRLMSLSGEEGRHWRERFIEHIKKNATYREISAEEYMKLSEELGKD